MLFIKRGSKVSLRLIALTFIAFISLYAITPVQHAQSGKPALAPRPSPTPKEEQEPPVRVFTEEVRLPVVAKDDYGHFDPTLEAEDLIVFEDGVQQEIK